MHPLDPANKTDYRDGDAVEFVLEGVHATGETPIYTGKIVGRALNPNVVDYWMILLDEKIEGYEYSAVNLPHMFIRRRGGNEPFLCDRNHV